MVLDDKIKQLEFPFLKHYDLPDDSIIPDPPQESRIPLDPLWGIAILYGSGIGLWSLAKLEMEHHYLQRTIEYVRTLF